MNKVVTYPNNGNISADDLLDGIALVAINATYNTKLSELFGGTFAYVITIFYGSASNTSRRLQVAYPYNSSGTKMAMRLYGSEGFTDWAVPTPFAINMSETNPTSGTTYRVPFRLNGASEIGYNDGLRYATSEGTTSTKGYGTLYLGNSIATGTAGNKTGRILLYGDKSGYTYLTPGNSDTSNITVYLPSSGGTLALQSDVDNKLPLSGGTLTSTLYTSSVRPRSDIEHNLGYSTVAYKNTYSEIYNIQSSGHRYGVLYMSAAGTTSVNGVGRLRLGNDIASGTAGNASGRIDFYGTSTGLTSLTPSNNTTSNIAVRLPSVSGIMPVVSVSGTTLTIQY